MFKLIHPVLKILKKFSFIATDLQILTKTVCFYPKWGSEIIRLYLVKCQNNNCLQEKHKTQKIHLKYTNEGVLHRIYY